MLIVASWANAARPGGGADQGASKANAERPGGLAAHFLSGTLGCEGGLAAPKEPVGQALHDQAAGLSLPARALGGVLRLDWWPRGAALCRAFAQSRRECRRGALDAPKQRLSAEDEELGAEALTEEAVHGVGRVGDERVGVEEQRFLQRILCNGSLASPLR